MRTRLQSLTILFALCFTSHSLAVTCYVYTQSQLQDALDCLANCGQCQSSCQLCQHKHISIPALDGQNEPVIVNISSAIVINSAHNGLRLTIAGTVSWTGGAGSSGAIVFNLVGASNVTIEGGGGTTPSTITSIYQPCVPGQSGGESHIAKAIRLDGCDGVTIQGLTFSKLSTAVECESESSTDLHLLNLQANEMARYGYFIDAIGVEIVNCHVYQMCNEHGFRLYASDVTIENCSSTGNGSTKKALWLVEGHDIVVDGFSSPDQRMDIGPNWSCNDAGPDSA